MTAVALPPSYYRVLGASGLSNLADGIRMAAFPLLAASLTDSATMVAAVFAAGEAPWIVFGLFAGKLADQVDRGRLIRWVTSARTVLLLSLAALIAFDLAPLLLVLIAAFVLGTAEVLADSATGALVPSLVAPEQLERANSRMVAAQIAGDELIGPALGGALFAAGASLPFLANGSLLALALLLLAGIPLLERAEPAHQVVKERLSVLDGVPFIRSSPVLKSLTWTTAVLAAIDAAWFALLVLFVRDELGLGPAGFGFALAVGAIGGLVGAALADRFPRQSLVTVSLLVFGSMSISLILLGLAPSVAMTVLALAVTSGGFALWNVHAVSARHRLTPNHMLGRVGATYRTVVVTAGLVGAVAGGVLADAFSLTGALVCYGIVSALLTPAAFVTFRRRTVESTER